MSEPSNTVTRFSDCDSDSLALLLDRYGLVLELVGSNMEIHGSFWGDTEAGLIGNTLQQT